MASRFSNHGSQHGMVLMSSLAILLGLMVVGLGAGMMLQNDLRVSANLRGSTEAFYYSSAGLEWGKREVARAESFPPAVSSRKIAFSSGAFAVVFLSPSVAGPLSARVVLRSIGTRGAAKHLIEAQVTKAYDLADAALALRGNGTMVNVSATGVFISGADHDETGASVARASPRSAVSAGDDALQSLFSHALAGQPAILDQSAGTPVLSKSDYLSSAFVSQFASELCASPEAIVHATASTASLIFENQSWGTHAAPQIRCFEGATESGDSVAIGANVSGAGILVIRNADLVLTGGFRWDGLVLITGSDISFKTAGADAKELFGAVIVNEVGIPGAGRKIVEFEGAVRIGFSRWALTKTIPLIPSSALVSAYGALPATILQNYWRSDTG